MWYFFVFLHLFFQNDFLPYPKFVLHFQFIFFFLWLFWNIFKSRVYSLLCYPALFFKYGIQIEPILYNILFVLYFNKFLLNVCSFTFPVVVEFCLFSPFLTFGKGECTCFLLPFLPSKKKYYCYRRKFHQSGVCLIFGGRKLDSVDYCIQREF